MRIQAAKLVKKMIKSRKNAEKNIFQGKKLPYLLNFAYLCAMFMAKSVKKSFIFASLATLFGAGLTGCASMGTPGGGLYDEDPPELRSSTPKDGGTHVSKRRITLHFNENVKLNNATEKMTVSPPQEKAPTILSNAKTVTIELQDTLRPNTTYSIDLGDAVQDNNEGNPMNGLSLLFSTGDHIDSLQISGHLLNAADLEPVTGAYVGIYKVREADGTPTYKDSIETESLGDSLLLRYPFERAGKTDALGAFKILGCSPGAYKVYALADGNTNYKYDLTSEDIAFLDSLVIPTMENKQRYDTVWAEAAMIEGGTADLSDSLGSHRQIDTVKVSGYIDYQPSDLLLYSFNEGKLTRYLDDTARPDSVHISIRFAAHMDSLPLLTFLTPDSGRVAGDSVLVAEPNPTFDTLTYWIRDSLFIQADTLKMEMTYLYTDTLGLDVPRTDTVTLLKPVIKGAGKEPKENKDSKGGDDRKGKKKRNKKDKKAEADTDSIPKIETVFMALKQIGSNNIGIGQKPRFEASAPLSDLNVRQLHLQYKRDSLWIDISFRLEPDSLHPRKFTLFAEPHFNPGTAYRFMADSASMHDIYGHPLNQISLEFKEKNVDEYAHLLFKVVGLNGRNAFIQLLDGKDSPVQQVRVVNNQAKFIHVPAGSYFARLVIDNNRNDCFDTGNLFEQKQPETVYYLNKKLDLRVTWTYDEEWDLNIVGPLEQKPDDVKINKPKAEKEKKSKNEEYLRKLGKL